mmetsp:Transcript_11682/g.33070  ORF Transcript_11682/g.33070 Transcript_11682/m.33070 type:complete len:133 (+) Transcript_11682:70-468(+)
MAAARGLRHSSSQPGLSAHPGRSAFDAAYNSRVSTPGDSGRVSLASLAGQTTGLAPLSHSMTACSQRAQHGSTHGSAHGSAPGSKLSSTTASLRSSARSAGGEARQASKGSGDWQAMAWPDRYGQQLPKTPS